MGAKFPADRSKRHEFTNDAVGFPAAWGPLTGPYASVYFCPIEGTDLRLTCYATRGNAGDFVPAETKHRGAQIRGGLFSHADGSVTFRPYKQWRHLLPTPKG